MAMRMYEYKIHVKVVEEQGAMAQHRHDHDQRRRPRAVAVQPLHRPEGRIPGRAPQNAFLASMAAEMKAHAATFKKYPPKDIGLAQ